MKLIQYLLLPLILESHFGIHLHSLAFLLGPVQNVPAYTEMTGLQLQKKKTKCIQ